MSLIQQLYKSMYSPKDMARYRFQKIGKTILYIFFLSLLTLIPEMIKLTQLVRTELSLVEQTIQEDLPDFKLEQGELKANLQEPVVKQADGFSFVFDPNSEEIPPSLTNEDGLFFLKHQAVLVTNATRETYNYSLLNETVIAKEDVETFLETIGSMYPIALAVFGTLLYLFDSFTTFVGVSLLAYIGVLFSSQMKRRLNYKQAWTLTAYSFTIPTVFFMIMKLLNTAVPQAFLIFITVVAFILYVTIKEIPPVKEK